MVSEGPGGPGTKIINKNYPAVEGLTAGTTKLKETDWKLEPEENLTIKKEREGFE